MQLVAALSPDMQKNRMGEQEFELGNFEKAEDIFLEVVHSNTNSQARNTALYNLACTRIVTATDSDEFMQAIDLLNNWKSTYPSTVYMENPNLLITALTSRSLIFQIDKLTLQEEHDSILSKAYDSKKVITMQKKEIEELQGKLQTLQHQIKELEAIDQQLQDKKKPL